MTDKTSLTFINEVISAIDSFQQDYGTLRYSITIQSYAAHHQLTVNVMDSECLRMVRFIIEQELYENAKIPSEYIYNLIKEKSEEMVSEKEIK